jgi:hypothetical protein
MSIINSFIRRDRAASLSLVSQQFNHRSHKRRLLVMSLRET